MTDIKMPVPYLDRNAVMISQKPCHGTERLHDNLDPRFRLRAFFRAWLSLEKIVQNAAISMSDPELPRSRLLASLLTRALYEWRVIRAVSACAGGRVVPPWMPFRTTQRTAPGFTITRRESKN